VLNGGFEAAPQDQRGDQRQRNHGESIHDRDVQEGIHVATPEKRIDGKRLCMVANFIAAMHDDLFTFLIELVQQPAQRVAVFGCEPLSLHQT
jgi:hypothetical protein